MDATCKLICLRSCTPSDAIHSTNSTRNDKYKKYGTMGPQDL